MTEDGSSLRLLTLTRLWLFGRFLYKFGDVRLWTPVPHRTIGYGSVVFSAFWVTLHLLGVPMGGPGLTFHFILPGVIVWWMLRAVGVGARPSEVASSWLRLGWFVARGRRVASVRVGERMGGTQ